MKKVCAKYLKITLDLKDLNCWEERGIKDKIDKLIYINI